MILRVSGIRDFQLKECPNRSYQLGTRPIRGLSLFPKESGIIQPEKKKEITKGLNSLPESRFGMKSIKINKEL